ncbi:MAG: hypothetical protein Tsb0018_04910 [Opitutales bacterium]
MGYDYPFEGHTLDEPPIQRILDDSLYVRDFFVKETTTFTPQSYYRELIASFARAGMGVPGAYFFYYVVSLLVLVGGALFLNVSRKLMIACAGFIIFWIFYVMESGSIGLVGSFAPIPVSAFLSVGLVLWGAAFALKHNWLLAYLFFGLAGLMSFLIGFVVGIVIVPLLFFDTLYNRHRFWEAVLAVSVWLLGLGCVYVPMYLSGAAEASLVSDQVFARVYGIVHSPQHLSFTGWHFNQWFWLVCFYGGGLLCLKRSPEVPRSLERSIQVIVLTTFVFLFLVLVFVQWRPEGLIAKLHLVRIALFSEFAIILGLAYIFQEALKKRQWVIAWLLLVIPVSSNAALFLLLFALSLPVLRGYRLEHISFPVVAWGFFLVCALMALPIQLVQAIGDIFPLITLAVLMVPALIQAMQLNQWSRLALSVSLALVMSTLCVVAIAYDIPKSLQSVYQHRLSIAVSPQDDLSRLAVEFKNNSSTDALILIPPSLNFKDFRRLSQRSVIVDVAFAPNTGQGLVEWHKRMENVLGEPLNPDTDIDAVYAKRSWGDIVEAAQQYGAEYILTRDDWHNESLTGESYLEAGPWEIYRTEDLIRSRALK